MWSRFAAEKLVIQEYRSPSNDEMGAIHLVYEKEKRPETQVTTIKDNSAKQKWAPVKRMVTRRATITNVYGDKVYTNSKLLYMCMFCNYQ